MARSNHLSLVLSPHYDDAAFSCGAAIHRWLREGRQVLVVNICAASPDHRVPLSPLSQELHDKMGGGDIVDNRRKEDKQALKILGVEHIELSFKDCIYRGPENEWYYQTPADIFNEVHQAESNRHEKIKQVIADILSPYENHTLIAPLAIGMHVDHQIVRGAAESFQKERKEVIYYEDYPYADSSYPHPLDSGNTSNLEKLLSSSSMKEAFVEISTDDLEAKVKAAMSYPSQLSMMFGDLASVPDRIRSFAEEGDRLVERFWKVDSF